MTFEQKLEKNELRKDIRKLSNTFSVIILVVYFLTNGLALLLTYGFPGVYEKLLGVFDNMVLGLIVQMIIVMVPTILIYSSISKTKVTSFYCKPDFRIRDIVKWTFITITASMIINLVFSFITMILQEVLGFTFQQVQFVDNRNTLNSIMMIFFIAIAAPFLEETIFRGFFLSKLMKFGSLFAIIVTGFIFGLYHMNLPQILPAMVMGIIMAFVTVKSRSIIPAVSIHFVNNTIGAFAQLITGKLDMDKYMAMDSDYISQNSGLIMGLGAIGFIIIGIMITGIILIIIELTVHRKNLSLGPQAASELTLGEKLGAFFSAPVTLITIVGMVAVTVYTVILGRS